MKKSTKINTGMILAAGFGTRMKEMAKDTPKALLAIGQYRLLDITISKLINSGIRKIVINLHYLGHRIKEHVEKSRYQDVQIIFSEEKEILGTGGGIALAEPHFADEPILVVNSDILSDICLTDFIDYHFQKNSIATMAAWPSKNSREYALLLYDKNKILQDILQKGSQPRTGGQTGIFMGYHILTPAARKFLRPVFSSVITDFYRTALNRQDRIAVYVHKGNWIDLGSKEHYFNLVHKMSKNQLGLEQFF